MFVKYRIHEIDGIEGFAPRIMTEEAACADLKLPSRIVLTGHEFTTVDLLISFEIPVDWCMYLQPRSSTFTRHGLLSTTGIIDSDYRGTVHAQLFNMNKHTIVLDRGIRLVQVQLFQKQRLQFEEASFYDEWPPVGIRRTIGSTGL